MKTHNRRQFLLTGLAGLTLAVCGTVAAQDNGAGKWSATGTLLEACTCAVPCTCNFGEGPSPEMYCHAVFAYRLDKANYDGIDLSGLILGGADGEKGGLGFLDDRATPPQRLALEKLARKIFAQGGPAGGSRRFIPVKITHEVKENNLRLAIAEGGGFAAKVLIGGDGKTPIVVENNTVWPIPRAIKGKTQTFTFKNPATGTIGGDGRNANYGKFTLSGSLR